MTMAWIWTGMAVLSILCGLATGRGELVAAVSAAIAEELGTDVSAIRILSLTPVGGVSRAASDRGALVAAVSAAIAEDLGTDVSAIRVLSMRQAA